METQEKEAESESPAIQQSEKAPVWTSWDNPVATPERWREIQRAVEAGMSQKEASEVFQVSYEAIRKRAAREEWITPARIEAAKEAKLAQTVPDKSQGPQNALVAVAETLESHRSQTLLGLAKTLKNAINSPEAQSIIPENVSELVQLGGLALKLYGIEQSNSVQVNIVTDGSADFGGDDFPVIDVND